MGMSGVLLGCLAACLALTGVTARFNIEEGGLKINFPPEAKQKYPKGFDMASFGCRRSGGQPRTGP